VYTAVEVAYLARMAHVRLVGGIATINRLADARSRDPDLINVYVRLFAKLNTGLLAIDPHSQTVGVGVPHDEARTLPARVTRSLGAAVGGVLPSELRAAHWGRVVEILDEQFGVSTDPETLMALPFNLLTVGGLAELVGSSGP
jgi:hypothetical protein